MGLFSDTKVRRESSEEKTVREMSQGMRAAGSSGSSSRVKGGGAPTKTKKYKEEDFLDYVQRVGKLKASTAVIRGIISRQLKATPNIQRDEMLRRVKRQLS